mmetsp:Transcript_23356/g.63326  ORF Transcript_23356/g.63326 Transcript_23356/m.63326 type:complete len:512 (-) Transcript_23356:476-2011(-)
MFSRIFQNREAVPSASENTNMVTIDALAAPEAPAHPPPVEGVPTITVSSSAEYEAVAANEEASVLAMASLRAVALANESVDEASKPPTDIVAVVDVSGSMAGSKMETMKQALKFVVEKGLGAQDSFSLVTFASGVDVELHFTKMDAQGKKSAVRVVEALHTKGATNLSGGLLQGLDLVCQKARAAGALGRGTTKSVLLFTDGQANNGVTDTPGIVAAVSQVLPQTAQEGSPASIFTFGFGADHNETMLAALADVSGSGQYFFVDRAEAIPVAFADALGGLVSVVAQNAELVAEVVEGRCTIGKVLGDAYKHEVAPDGSRAALHVGDLYAEDEKDLIVEIKLPKAAVAQDAPLPHITWSIRYFSVQKRDFETSTALLCVSRPLAAPVSQAVNPAIVEQRERLYVAEVMKNAADIADGGDVKGGQALLREAEERLRSSDVKSPMVTTLVEDLATVSAQYATRELYESEGRKTTWMSSKVHYQQRSAMTHGGAYEKRSKKAMKSRFVSAPPSAS